MLIKLWNNFSNFAPRWVKGVILKVTDSFLKSMLNLNHNKQNYDAWFDGNFKMYVTFQT